MGVTGSLLAGCSVAAAGAAALVLSGRGGRRLRARRALASFEGIAARVREAPLLRRARRAEELERRRASCLSELPVMLDVVTLGLSAGLSFDASLELFCSRGSGPLSGAFEEAMLSWRIGVVDRERALWGLADELGVAALRRFAGVVGEALAFGSPLAEALERQAQVIRDEQRAQVEAEIERVPVKMLVPLGTLIVPAMFLAILGPLLGSVVSG